MRFQLPPLPYKFDALVPHISPETLATHYGKHHKGYVDKTNDLLEAPTAWQEDLSLEEIVKTSSGPLFNSAAQAWNHTFFWHCLAPDAGGEPPRELIDIFIRDFGSFEHFRQIFSQKAADVFGSGYTWLVLERTGRLNVLSTANADTPLVGDDVPLLTLDVWEHAYYLDYRHDRSRFIEKFWNLVNWEFVLENFERDSAPNFTSLMRVTSESRQHEAHQSQPGI